MNLRNNKGQTTVALVIVVGLIAFILMSNLQKQTLFVVKKVIEMKVQAEGESAINDFALQLYNAYIQAAVVPDALQLGSLRLSTPSVSYPTTLDPKDNLDFYLNGNKLCAARMRLISNNLDICINLPADFVTLLERQQQYHNATPENQFYVVNILKRSFSVSKAWAQTQPAMALSRPDASLAPPLSTVNRTPTTAEYDLFKSQYDQYNCDNPALPSRIACVKIQICLKISGCATDAEKIKQTFVFLRNPTTQLRE